ncbi:MAG: hypothetical protein USCAAHI_01215 [Beijerinckiaceae bacterium]|nr:MAG: hypothetical protein USCAAHI_01215 [Beijerinckiaceae bacterium]
MNPQDQQFWIVFILIGVPIIILAGGPYGWRFLVLLGALAGLASHPLITGAVLRTPARWALEGFIFGIAGGLGARLSGVFSGPERAERQHERWVSRRPRIRERGAPRARGRRPQQYFPFDDGVDHLGD